MSFQYTAPEIKGPKTIYTIRHGQSIGNELGLDNKSLEDMANHQFPLTKKGHAQIALSAQFILDKKLIKLSTKLYASNFLRTQETINGILKKHKGKYKVTIDPRLDEWWKGIFHSLSKEKLAKHYPLESKIKDREGWHHYRPPQGQAGKDIEINLISFLLSEISKKEIFISGHGESFSILRRLLTNQPVDLNDKYPAPKNGEIWKFTRKGNFYDFKSLYIPEVK